jgi:hypothetical protein
MLAALVGPRAQHSTPWGLVGQMMASASVVAVSVVLLLLVLLLLLLWWGWREGREGSSAQDLESRSSAEMRVSCRACGRACSVRPWTRRPVLVEG